MKIAIMAPLVTAIREPQRGGSQAFVSDLARGLAGRGHDVHVYAASGSEIPGVEVIDTGIDPGSLAGTLYRASGPAAGDPGEAGRRRQRRPSLPSPPPITAMQAIRYDVIHNHAFDAPAVRLAAALPAPVVHTLHLPPDEAVSAALRAVRPGAADRRRWPPYRNSRPAPGAGSSASTRSCRRTRPPVSFPGRGTAGPGALFAGRLSPEKGAAEAIDIARAAGVAIDVYGDVYDAGYSREQIDPRRAWPGRDRSPGSAAGLAVGGHGARGRGAVSRPLGRALRDGRRRGAGVRDSRRGVPARRPR